MARGLKTYNTGRSCRHGHYSDRRTDNGSCCECGRIAANKWNQDHLGHVKKRNREWERNNRDKTRAYFKNWYQRKRVTTS